ncbi:MULTISPECIES: cytochrome c oxidase subunit 4 [Gordonia]|uniref:Cytochrome c oxidase polypeptide 4 n=2 Tax=Gordonia TaxID=2053 RepID=L7LIQ8_9ACTN|nr:MULTISPECIES: cytochrome c oxidase subunit 4 [Gordonia]AUH68731.1 cytochrome c oxidase subunit 4 [Gordonia sp. YC-JH1]KJR06084.1 cytochrome C oxidase subunit IV [Gordonia sihwensis]KXT58017.1 cytochrome C oxidase subunit IV [Gordonia sp. QH-12]MBY4571323.1 cytochrome C oxidase subunit IV [Gordonia sihwensis]GAC59967.1 cytochrome c oxidase subunit IV [Gordonia sihwensis NBRC 108236]
MKVEARVFEALALFFILMGVIYAVATFYYRTGVEWAGATAMFFSGGLALIAGTYFRFVARRVEIRPEDYEEAEIEDGAGELGFFSPHSYWPIMIAGGAALFAIGFASSNWWFAIGLVPIIVGTVAGLVFEYHVGPEKH